MLRSSARWRHCKLVADFGLTGGSLNVRVFDMRPIAFLIFRGVRGWERGGGLYKVVENNANRTL